MLDQIGLRQYFFCFVLFFFTWRVNVVELIITFWEFTWLPFVFRRNFSTFPHEKILLRKIEIRWFVTIRSFKFRITFRTLLFDFFSFVILIALVVQDIVNLFICHHILKNISTPTVIKIVYLTKNYKIVKFIDINFHFISI